MFPILDNLKQYWPIAVCIAGIALIGYLGEKLVRWIMERCAHTEKVDNVASPIFQDLTLRRLAELDRLKTSQYVLANRLERSSKCYFQIATRHLYLPFTQEKGEVSIVVHNAADGFGDHAHGVAVTNQIVKDFPHITATLHTFFAQNLDTLPPLTGPDSDRATVQRYAANDKEPIKELKKKIEQSACVLEVSHETLREVIGIDTAKKNHLYTYLREYGCSANDDDFCLPMGLGDQEEGMFFKEIPYRPLSALQDERIKNILFEGAHPTQEVIEAYQNSRHLHLFYHKLDFFYQASDLYIVAELHKDSSKQIDVILPIDMSMEWLMHWNILDRQVLKQFGIGSIRVLRKDTEETIPIAETGKELRIIHPAFLPQHDFYTLLSNCEEPFGCTGDHTFTDAHSVGRIANYELRAVKWGLFSSWMNICDKQDAPLVKTYLEAIRELFDGRTETFRHDWNAQLFSYDDYHINILEKMAPKVAPSSRAIVSCMQHPDFKAQWKKVNQFLRQNCDIRYNLQGLVARHLAFAHFPHLAKVEETCYADFRSGKKSIHVVQNELKQAIDAVAR